MSVNKHKALQTWVQPFLGDNHLFFETADAYPGIREVVPTIGEYLDSTDICGNKYKGYAFVFIGYETLDSGTSDVNTANMGIFDKFIEWLEEQQKNKNFPDFGDNCGDYDVSPVQNMADMSFVDEDMTAKYMLAAEIKYKEEA